MPIILPINNKKTWMSFKKGTSGPGWIITSTYDRNWSKYEFACRIIKSIELAYDACKFKKPIEFQDWSGIQGQILNGHPGASHSGGYVVDFTYPSPLEVFGDIVLNAIQYSPNFRFRIHFDIYNFLKKKIKPTMFQYIKNHLEPDNVIEWHHDKHCHCWWTRH